MQSSPQAPTGALEAAQLISCPISSVEHQNFPSEVLAVAEMKALPRRFTGEPITGFGALA